MKREFTLFTILFISMPFFNLCVAQTFTTFENLDGDNSLLALAVDEVNDRVWVGTNATTTGETIAFLENGNWTTLNANTLDLLQGRAEDMIVNDGIVEVGSFGGLSRIDWDNQSFDTWASSNSDMATSSVLSLAKDPFSGLLYVGIGSGFETQTYDGSSWSTLVNVNGAKSMAVDKVSGDIWIGTSVKGLFKVSENETTNFIWSNSNIPSGEIVDLEVASDGSIWMLIDDKGLVHFEGSTFTQYSTSNSNILTDEATVLAIDNEDKVWFSGPAHNALTVFDGASFTDYKQFESDLPTDNIRQMKADSEGNIWMATAVGLVKLSQGTVATNSLAPTPIYLFPNPATDIIEIKSGEEFSEFQIHNSLGQLINSGQLSNSINVQNLSSPKIFMKLK